MPPQNNSPLYLDVIKIGSIWFMAMASYHIFLPELGISLSYNSTPYLSFIFFVVFIFISIYSLSHVYHNVSLPMDERWWAYALVFTLYGTFLFVALRILELNTAVSTLTLHPEIVSATPMYFLPKTAEVLLQHILIITLVIALSRHIKSLRGIIGAYAAIFGGAHLWLYFLTDVPTLYTLIVTISAILSSLVFPYLITRVKSGFMYGFLIHLAFYVVVAVSFSLWP